MSLIKKFIDDSRGFFESKFNFLKSKNTQELNELKKVETQLKKLSEQEEKTGKQTNQNTKTMLKFRLAGLLIVFLGYVAFRSLNIIYLVLAAFIISIAMEAIIDFFEKLKLHRGLALVVSYFLLIIFLLAGFIFIVPFLLNQITDIIQIGITHISNFQTQLQTKTFVQIINELKWLPHYLKDFLSASLQDPALLSNIQTKTQSNISQIINIGTTYLSQIGNLAVTFVTGFMSFLGQGTIALTLSILFSIEKGSVGRFLVNLGGEKSNKYLTFKLERIYKKLGIWLKSQFLLCLFIGLAVYLSLWILSWFGLDLPQKGSLAMIAGLTEFIPYLGPILGSIAGFLVAMIHYGIGGALVVVVVYIIIQQLENNVIVPLLMKKTLGMNPIVIFISMIFGGLIMGFIGVLLAVPIAVIGTLLIEKDFD